MEIEIVVAASKRAQQTRDVPSFVSVVTAAEIKEHGYRTLADVLQDRGPASTSPTTATTRYVGVRGFSAPATTTRASCS